MEVRKRRRRLFASIPSMSENVGAVGRRRGLKRDGFRMNHHRALVYCLRMIFSENRFTLFRIMR
jgi:hypothetical protein